MLTWNSSWEFSILAFASQLKLAHILSRLGVKLRLPVPRWAGKFLSLQFKTNFENKNKTHTFYQEFQPLMAVHCRIFPGLHTQNYLKEKIYHSFQLAMRSTISFSFPPPPYFPPCLRINSREFRSQTADLEREPANEIVPGSRNGNSISLKSQLKATICFQM